MDHIAALLPKVLHKRGLQEHAKAAQVCWLAKNWVQENLSPVAAYLEVTKYTNGELFIATQNSIAAQECRQASTALLEHLHKECAHLSLANIRITREK